MGCRPEDYSLRAECKIGLLVPLVCKPHFLGKGKGSVVLESACDFLGVKGKFRERD